MTLAGPWTLVSTAALPSSLRWLALAAVPVVPVDLSQVQALAEQDVEVTPAMGLVNEPSQGQLAFRDFSVSIRGISTGTGYPYTVAALAVFDSNPGGDLVAWWELDSALVLEDYSTLWTIRGQLYAAKYQPNG